MQYILFVILAPAVTVLTVTVAVMVHRRPLTGLARPLSFALWMGVGFLVTNTLELVWPTPGGTMLFAKLSYPFSTAIPAAVLLFASAYTGHQGWFSHGRRMLLFVVPLATSLLALTEPLHGLIWRSVAYTPVAGMLAMNVEYGWFFWVNFGYAVGALLGSFVLMIRENFNKSVTSQSILVIVGVLVPQILFVIYTLKLIPGFTKNYSPIAYAVTCLCFVAAIRRYQFLDIVPIARRTLMEEMDEAMVVLDAQDRVVEANPKACSALGIQSDAIGRTVDPASALASIVTMDLSKETHREVAVGSGPGVMRYYDAHLSVIRDRAGKRIGSMVLLRDVTDTHVLLEEKNRLIEQLTRASAEIKTLQGIIPICMYCKKIRDDEGYWQQVETYVSERSSAQFSHGLCPDCLKQLEQGRSPAAR